MLIILTRRKLRRLLRKTYEEGIAKGYELGYKMRQSEESVVGFVIGGGLNPKLIGELSDILEKGESNGS